MADFLTWAGSLVTAVALALWAWRRWAPVSFWYVIGFPIRAVAIYGTWRAVASGCGLSKRRRRWRWTLPGWGAE
ncbi:hypothetical protein AB0K05_13050 [Nonomuraea sp. NPDC049486]|uniref:hypothetical protein n=1 Tax=Nonomuraea sp. NPDC049486 TaxID=3155773 RepID=UPI003426E002